MKPNRWLALGAALAGCSIAYAVHLMGKPHPLPPKASLPAGSKGLANAHKRSPFKPSSSSPTGNRALSETRAQNNPGSADSKTPVHLGKIHGAPHRHSAPMLTEEQWRENAARVEMEANHELKRLTGLLDLDPAQQEQMFASRAQRSGSWLPGMYTGVAPRTNPTPSDDSQSSVASDRAAGSSKTGSPASDSRNQPTHNRVSKPADQSGHSSGETPAAIAVGGEIPDTGNGGAQSPPGTEMVTAPTVDGTPPAPAPAAAAPASDIATTPSVVPATRESSPPARAADWVVTSPADADQSTPPPTVNDMDVSGILTSDQEQTLVQEEMDRLAWWEEVLPQLLPPQLPAVAATPLEETPASAPEPPPDTKVFDGGEMLLDE